jgi:hypothetical protein
MTITNCPMCEWEIPGAQSETIKSCAECGADLSRWTARRIQPPPIPVEVECSDDDGWYFARQAATFSLAAPFIAMGVTWFSRGAVRDNRIGTLILGSIIDLLIVSGFILGVIALVRTKKCGREGIFGKAIAGVCINGLFIVGILITLHLLTKYSIELENGRQRQRQIQRPW